MDRILHYEIAEQLGEGKNGAAFLAVDSGLQRAVVIKKLKPKTLLDEEGRRKAFLEQMESFSALDLAGIARFYSLEQIGTDWIVVREHVEGKSVANLVRGEALPYGRWLEVALRLARMLKSVHDAGLVHGNIRAGNVFVAAHSTVSLADHGLGAINHRDREEEAIYSAPESAGDQAPSVAEDLYALGVVLFILLVGMKPVRPTEKTAELAFGDVSEPKVPGVARLLISRLMAANPKDRFGCADELILTLQGMISLGTESPEPLQLRRWSPTPRQYLMMALLVMLLIILWLAITSNPR